MATVASPYPHHRERAIVGEAALKEAQKDAVKNESRIMDAVAAAEDMPTVPTLTTPSLGGLLAHMHEDVEEEASLGADERAKS